MTRAWARPRCSRTRPSGPLGGLRVLSVTGLESESELAFAGLHQLLRPVLYRVAAPPARQAQALLGALGCRADLVASDPLLTGVAVLTLLSDLSERPRCWCSPTTPTGLTDGSLGTLAFVARRLDAEPVVLLLAVRGQAPRRGSTTASPR